MRTTGWARYPSIDASLLSPDRAFDLEELSNKSISAIPRGMGRSYGDSSLARTVLSSEALDHFISFNPESGILRCEAGVTLSEILCLIVPYGWFLTVTPGTKFVSVGGAISSDVHGKNHHVDGCFSNHIRSLTLRTATNENVVCSNDENVELFRTTCGGMGLTGLIIEAELQLKKIETAYINETVFKARNLDEILSLFEQHGSATYSVAWIDCLSRGPKLGRSLLMLGEHVPIDQLEHKITDPLHAGRKQGLPIPCDMPSWILNSYTVRAFNQIYYNRASKEKAERCVHYEPFFYPLDSLKNWNRLYGKNGFVQYQCVLPKSTSKVGLSKLLEIISSSQKGSFLAVLKAFGPENDNYLSFPFEGYTLALDFKIEPDLSIFLQRLDQVVLENGGRLYLAKDSRMQKDMLRLGYPNWEKFQQVRQLWKADKLFNSIQSHRLGF